MRIDAESLFEKMGDWYSRGKQRISQHKLKLFAFAFVIALVLYMGKYVIPAFLLVSILVVSMVTTRLDINILGIEVTTFSTVMMGVIFGPETGALLGFLFILVELFTGNPPGVYMLWVVPGYVLAGYLAGVFSGMDIFLLGMYTSIGLQSFFLLCTSVVITERVPKYMQFTIFNILFNVMLFKSIGPHALELLRLVT